MPSEFRVYRAKTKHSPEERQDMIVPDPKRGFICATEVNEKRAMQWALSFSETQRRDTFEVRELRNAPKEGAQKETVVAKFRAGRKFL